MNRNTLFAIILYFCFYFIFVTTSFFTAPFVGQIYSEATNTAIEHATVTVGYGFNLSLFIGILLMLVIAFFQDTVRLKRKNTLIVTTVIAAISYILFITTSSSVILYVFIINSAIIYCMPAFLDSFVLAKVDEERYFFVRSFGSFGAAVSYLLSSFLIGNLSYTFICAINIILLLLMLSVLLLSENVVITKKQDYVAGLKSLKNSKYIIVMFAIAFLTYGVIRADDPFTYTFNTTYAGITPLVIGIIGLISIAFEGIIMNVYNFLLKYMNRFHLLLIAVVSLFFIFITKYLFYDIAWVINLGNIMFGIYVGFFVPIMIYVISKYGQKHVESTLLSINQIVVLIGGLILGTITTFILDQTQFLPDIYLLHSIIILISLPLLFVVRKIDTKN